ncbi:MAG: polysaccharide deacetylase family protein [Calditerrivibrio sp.]|nr:polysaccharide deacetylase family protein [Calditerrivibrio sp.]
MNRLFLSVIFFVFAHFHNINAEVINYLPTEEKVVFITFDACETKTPSYFDQKILDYILKNQIPVTIFLSGKFIKRNIEDIKLLVTKDFISLQNHSYQHNLHMENLSEKDFVADILKTSKLIEEITGKKVTLFRFPGGNYNKKSLKLVESLGYRVVHWSFESGDPSKNVTPDMLFENVKKNVKPGSIMIFHINGRGWSTGEALPKIVEFLKKENYSIVKIEEMLTSLKN